MKRIPAIFLTVLFLLPPAYAEELTSSVTRSDALTTIWAPLKRPAEKTYEIPFSDVSESHPNFQLITYAKARGIVDDGSYFSPEDPILLNDALIWLLRSRNVAPPSDISEATLTNFITRYPLTVGPQDIAKNEALTSEKLIEIIRALDDALKNEIHAVSYYSLDFAGRNTAFGEFFDPNALTAAHRTLPHNTMVRVTNQDNGKSIDIRINDRGPYVSGRDMDLSRAAFGRIGSLSRGVLTNVTFERLGHATEVKSSCSRTRYRRRLGNTLLFPGFPTIVEKGTVLEITANNDFRVLQMRKPRSRPIRSREWTDRLEISFDQVGTYTFVLHEDGGRRRRFRTMVVNSCN